MRYLAAPLSAIFDSAFKEIEFGAIPKQVRYRAALLPETAGIVASANQGSAAVASGMADSTSSGLARALSTGLGAGTAALFYGLTRARGKRFFHPDGRAYRGTYELDRLPDGWAVPRASLSGSAVVRLSRGASLTRLLPDVLGTAIRLENIYGRGNHQDFLLVTSNGAPVLRHALLPATSFSGDIYSSILPYSAGGSTTMIGARTASGNRKRPELGEGMTVNLLASDLTSSWARIGSVRLTAMMSEAESEDLRFNPWHTGGGLAPAGFINDLRRNVYRASQSARSAAQRP
ncbi:MAG: hypothetical protein ABR573_04260 [Candidatus Dormibacteria bacterium]